MLRLSLSIAPLAAVLACLAGPAQADKIRHPTAVFAGLDKISGRIISFDVAADETVQFGSLQVTPRACFTRPPTEAPQTTGFVEIDEVIEKSDNKKIFSGWMFAASPGLHGVEHAVYDVWLTDCKGGSTIVKETAALPEENILAPSPRPGTTPRVRQPLQAPPGEPQPGVAGPLDPGGVINPPAATAGRPRNGQPPLPPGQVPAAAATRRAPTQSFFPTVANPGESLRDREREKYN